MENENGSGDRPDQRPKGFPVMMNYLVENKIDTAMWITRLFTIVFSVFYIIPIFGLNPYVSFQRALLSNAATSALKLHQRMSPGGIRISQEFFARLIIEDSCHYLIYSLVFLMNHPITVALVPILLFAVLHSASYTLNLLDKLGQNSWWLGRILISLVEFQQTNMLRMIAFCEIIMMPIVIAMLFAGKASLIVPFVYYRFLTFRYISQRNPYNRKVFSELKMAVTQFIMQPSVPAGIRALVIRAMGLLERLAPATVAQ